MASTRGPVPKRSEQRRRSNKPEVPIESAPNAQREPLGPGAPEWLGGLARDWYESLRTSGQAVFYTASDWQSALILAKAVATFEARPSAHMLTAILQGFGSLAATEGDRRRLRIELERAKPGDADEQAAVADMDAWRSKLSS